jgi:hypothetical protein
MQCDADFVTGAIKICFSAGLPEWAYFLGWYSPVCDGKLFVA